MTILGGCQMYMWRVKRKSSVGGDAEHRVGGGQLPGGRRALSGIPGPGEIRR